MTALVFVDTNILIYYLDKTDPRKHGAARHWLAELWRSRQGRISFQVLQEFYSTATHKWPRLSPEVRAEIRELMDWRPIALDSEVLERGWRIQDRYKISFWDALIVSAAKATSCHYLLTEDLQAGQDLDGVVVVNPFWKEPNEIWRG